MLDATLCARPPTEDPAGRRAPPRLTTGPRGALRREPIRPREAAAPAACAPRPHAGGRLPHHDGDNRPLGGVIALQGAQAVMTGNGATAAEGIRADVKQVLGPTRAPGDIVVREPLSAPNAVGVPHARARRRVRWRSLPPYAPELSSMAWGGSPLTTALRAAKARTREPLETAIRQALETVTSTTAWHCFNHGG